jgi:regulator of replication initiation timing
MNSVVEKLAAIEKEVAAIQPKMAPLTERIADLDQKVAGFAQQLTGIAEESAAVKQDIELTRQSLTRIQTLIGESKTESEQLAAGQEENLQRCETMQAVFGAAFQAVSQFFETAQRMGLADQAKAVFLNPSASPPEETADGGRQTAEEVVESEPAELEIPEPPVMEPPPVTDIPVAEPPITESTEIESPEAESVLSESDFDSVMPDAGKAGPDSWSVPGLPDVATLPEIPNADLNSTDADAEADTEPSDEMASQLEVQPLNLSVPALQEQSEPVPPEMDDQDIEDMLATMGAPLTASAGN